MSVYLHAVIGAISFLTVAHCAFPAVNQQLKILTAQEWMKGQVEIVFLLDRSGSVGAASFEDEKGFVESFLTHMIVAPNATRVAVISYSAEATRHVDFLKDPRTKCALYEELQDVIFKDSGKTNIEAALEEAKDVFKNARPNAKKVVMLLSDGLANYGGDPVETAKKLKNDGVEIFTFGIGRFLRSELQLIASSPKHFYDISDFKEFKKLAKLIKGDDPHGLRWSESGGPRRCDYLCDSEYKGEPDDPGCCDHNAKCSCGLVAGTYQCVCGPGFYGISGLIGECKECPLGTYKEKYGSAAMCTKCPPHSTTNDVGSKSIDDCRCLEGYEKDEKTKTCKIIRCPPLQPPTNGMIIGPCNNHYNSICRFGCEDGYSLKNTWSSERICLANREWSGDTPVCERSRCPKLASLENGYVDCDSNEPLVGTSCKFQCNRGYYLLGSGKVTCTENMRWSRKLPICAANSCPPPPSLPHGTWKRCPEGKIYDYKHICVPTCNEGYKLIPSDALLECKENGTWGAVGNSILKPKCVDSMKPKLICPKSRSIITESGKSYATYKLEHPKVSDNSGEVPTVTIVSPSLKSPIKLASLKWPMKLPIGETTIYYKATDSSRNSNTCSFTITVKDKEAPKVVFCPSNIEVNTTELEESVTWPQPLFTDNSNIKKLSLFKTASSGDMFTPGRHKVTYTARDGSGNTQKCVFDVIVNKLQCKFYPPPQNGALACDDWLYGQFCQAYCEDRFDFVAKPADWYICESDLQWSTEPPGMPVPWPDCGELHHPNKVRRTVSSHYYTGKCENVEVQKNIKEVFIHQFKSTFNTTEYCKRKGSCTVEVVKVKCGISDLVNIRVRRNIHSEVDKEVLEVEAEVTVANEKEDNSKETLDHMILASEEIVSQVQKVATKEEIAVSQSDVTRLVRAITVEAGEPQIICNPGSVKNEVNECVECPAGSFHNETSNSCQECPLGTYQDEKSQMTCIKCPAGTWTDRTHCTNVSDCIEICRPGTFSENGLETCQACPKGTYQDMYQRTTCKVCPSSTTTWTIGADNKDDCKETCEPGTFSDTGLHPCTPCPVGFYASESGQMECLECDGGLSTPSVGSKSISDCIEINPCSSSPCLNNGNCTRVDHSFTCECPEGFEGPRCEENVDDCKSSPCFNDGVCIDGVNSFSCVCPRRYTGQYCEEVVNECASSPCKNGGTCHYLVDGFWCLCTPGFTGQQCEQEVDICELLSCKNGATCVVSEEDHFCMCPEGFDGYDCSENIDDCQTVRCVNGGTCIDGVSSYTCNCPEGFLGEHCEIDIDRVETNNGSCGSNAANSNCKKGITSSNFILSLGQEKSSDAALSSGMPKLYEVTVAMSIQTTDKSHAGTIISYATRDEDQILDNALRIKDPRNLKISVNNEDILAGLQLSDGQWHHLTFTWSSIKQGGWRFYHNCALSTSGFDIQAGHPIPENGIVVIGQDQDSIGGDFSPMESYIGNITRLNIWERALNEAEVQSLCRKKEDQVPGRIKAWTDFLNDIRGNTKILFI